MFHLKESTSVKKSREILSAKFFSMFCAYLKTTIVQINLLGLKRWAFEKTSQDVAKIAEKPKEYSPKSIGKSQMFPTKIKPSSSFDQFDSIGRLFSQRDPRIKGKNHLPSERTVFLKSFSTSFRQPKIFSSRNFSAWSTFGMGDYLSEREGHWTNM